MLFQYHLSQEQHGRVRNLLQSNPNFNLAIVQGVNNVKERNVKLAREFLQIICQSANTFSNIFNWLVDWEMRRNLFLELNTQILLLVKSEDFVRRRKKVTSPIPRGGRRINEQFCFSKLAAFGYYPTSQP